VKDLFNYERLLVHELYDGIILDWYISYLACHCLILLLSLPEKEPVLKARLSLILGSWQVAPSAVLGIASSCNYAVAFACSAIFGCYIDPAFPIMKQTFVARDRQSKSKHNVNISCFRIQSLNQIRRGNHNIPEKTVQS